MKKTYFSFLSSSKFDCSLLWGLFCSALVKRSAVSLQNDPSALSHTLQRLTSLSILNARWQRRRIIYLFTVTNCSRSLSSSIFDVSLKEKGIKETSEFNQRPAASGSVTAAVSLLTGDWRPCVQIGTEKKRSTARGCELSLSVFEWQNVPPPMNTKGNLLPLFITQLF